MAAITRIDVEIRTGDRSGAGTDGSVYVAIAGREFNIDSAVDDFERNSDRVYTLGAGGNVNNAQYNDPTKFDQLDTADADHFPAWVRFEPAGSSPDWNLERVIVTINPGPGQVQFEGLGGSNNLWMGQKMGKFCFLKRIKAR